MSSNSHITAESGGTCLGCCAQTCSGAKRRLRERGILSCDSDSGFVADGIFVGQG